ncbi:hypothetical protein BKI52_15500 [marine bacterium AO1-C]|nr:hypothetical protein BKI52_15500 [marine bacterium AO1-C]
MNTLHLHLSNPITLEAVKQLETDILNASAATYDFLIIDTGAHDFETIQVLKALRQTLETLEDSLLQYQKIALIYPAKYDQMSEFPDKLQYFHTQQEAEAWFME